MYSTVHVWGVHIKWVSVNSDLTVFIWVQKLFTVKPLLYGHQLNPLSPSSDQDQISPNNIHTLSRDKLWELIKWSHKRKCLDLLSNSLNSFFKEMYRDQFGEFVCGYLGLKGLIRTLCFHGQFSLSLALTFSLNLIRVIRTPDWCGHLQWPP